MRHNLLLNLRLLAVSSILLAAFLPLAGQRAPQPGGAFRPGARVVLNAHNCYPYEGKYADRIDRALSTGVPVSIELDLAWHQEAGTAGKAWSVLSHETRTHGDEPTLDAYFFEKVRPLVEKELRAADPSRWPVVYLHFNFKSTQREHVQHVARILAKYQDWLSSAERVADVSRQQPIRYRPILVMTETDPTEKAVFHDDIAVGERFFVFGSAPGERYLSQGLSRDEQLTRLVTAEPSAMLAQPADNYRRWWNNSWAVVERGGSPRAADWTSEDAARLGALVTHAHRLGYMIRFYTLNGHAPQDGMGWGSGYNFGSPQAAKLRWEAAAAASVDFIATDQYEALRETLAQSSKAPKTAAAQ